MNLMSRLINMICFYCLQHLYQEKRGKSMEDEFRPVKPGTTSFPPENVEKL